MLPAGYRVRTLHGLAHDIVRERPGLVDLEDHFQIVDERASSEILREASGAWLRGHPEAADTLLVDDLSSNQRGKVLREDWPALVQAVAGAFIRKAKDIQATPQELRDRLALAHTPLPLVDMCLSIYSDYQRALGYRGGVDFDDLVRLALQALRRDPEYLERLHYRWKYILEDEAQDSSRLQEQILRSLVGPNGNWVRVGDPNQAIYETFTTADPRYLREFIQEVDQKPQLLNSGRSTQSIIDLANYLVNWSRAEHPIQELRDALADTPIRPTPLGDPQPNPPDDPRRIYIAPQVVTPDKELRIVVDSIEKWLPEHQDETVAILTPSNMRGAKFVEALRARDIACIEILRSTHATREAARILSDAFFALADPGNTNRLAKTFEDWCACVEEGPVSTEVFSALRKCRKAETFIWPKPGEDWVDGSRLDERDPIGLEKLLRFRQALQRWHAAVLLPVDQLALIVAGDLFTQPTDLALAYKLATLLETTADDHPEWRLADLAADLQRVVDNKRALIGFDDDDLGFDPLRHRGKVVVATLHKAKGLEWDRVYLTSINNYDFPACLPNDSFQSEKWFVRGKLNLEAETLNQLEALLEDDPVGWNLEPGAATRRARLDVAAERLRLLYVGITRARKDLIITSNSGRYEQVEAVALTALRVYWEGRSHAVSG
jgi:DNA helicase-2/ATP-dependent DNA helicase PcrA